MAGINSNPLVSVIVATYNRAELIPHAINSILRQSYAHLELVIVSDGSTDNTDSVVASFSDPRIRFISQQHTGLPAAARNRGIAQARGGYIAFCDDDDLWLPDKLKKQVAFMDLRPDVGLCFGYAAMFGDTQYRGVTSHLFKRKVAIMTFEELFLASAIPCLTVMVRRQCLEDVGTFDEDPEYRLAAEDYDLWLRISKTYKVACIPEILGEYRVHRANISKDHVVTCMKYLKVIEKIVSKEIISHSLVDKRKSDIFWLLGNAHLAQNNRGYKEFYEKSIQYHLSLRSIALAVFTLLPKTTALYLFGFCRKIKILIYRMRIRPYN